MSGFLYFIEGQKAAGSDILEAAGLSHALTEGEITTCETTKGPGKKGGIVAAVAGTEAALVKYVPTRQAWAPIENDGSPGAWIGYYTDDPPGPMDLFRADPILDGYYRIFDSISGPATWVIPRARIFNEDVAGGTIDGPTSDLPQAVNMVGGQLVRKPLPRYRQACLDAEKIWAGVMNVNNEETSSDDAVEMTPVEEFEISTRILGINYRVGLPEVNALDVLTTVSMTEIVKCFVDFPTWAKVQIARNDAKKNAGDADTPDGGDSNSGPPDA